MTRRVYSTVRVRTLVLLDQAKVHADAAAACQRELGRLEKAEAELLRFEAEDREPFGRWMAATFGPTLTTLRELNAEIATRSALVAKVEEEMFWTGETSERAAFARVRMREENPDLVAATNRAVPRGNAPMWERTAPQQPDDARIKQLYRVLVRRLHPDMRAKDAPDVSALWHEAQEAYATGNVERLESLAGMTDTAVCPQTSVSQMQATLKNIRAVLAAAQQKLRAARADAAWHFAKLGERTQLERKMQTQLDAETAEATKRLNALKARIAGWTSTKAAQKKAKPRAVPGQAELW